ncbi:hypothetical protein Acr_07g0014360 [Actinidia rufa]|uniref:Uncharacterized protein n=1 Tax=Actinidia rufa TaxID=165716 RepID=A0A7J0EXT4_9ERIC|nr:hypothetical protein Acr_07g0014360 [Actinidia rufa]
MMQNGGRYVGVPIGSDETVSSMFGFAIANGSQMVEMYLTSRLRGGNETGIEWTADPSSLGGNTRELILVQEIINREPLLGMTSAPYCCGEIEVSDEEDDCNINRVEEDEPIIQFMTSPTPEFEDVGREAQATCNDWACNHRLSSISDDDLQIGQQFRDKSQCIIVVKRWHIKNELRNKSVQLVVSSRLKQRVLTGNQYNKETPVPVQAYEAEGLGQVARESKSIAFNELFAPAEASPEPESVTYRVVAAGRVGLVSRIEESGH